MSFDKKKRIKNVEGLAAADLITATHSDWAGPSILVPRKDGTYSLVRYNSGLDRQKAKTYWPLSRINDVIDSMGGKLFFSRIFLTSGYFQMALKQESQNLAAFTTPLGLYKRKGLPIGLESELGAFQNQRSWCSSVFLAKLPSCIWVSVFENNV